MSSKESRYSRRVIAKGLLTASTVPFVLTSRAFAASCDDHVVRLGGIAAPRSLNPFASWTAFWPLVFTYDWLVSVEGIVHPDRRGFAKDWSVADDGVTWTFKIWPGMKWSDGRPATARDAAFTYNYLRDSIGTPDELNAGYNNTTGFEVVNSITALDDETLQIATKVPTRWPLERYTMIVPEHIWKGISYAEARGTFRNDPPLVGTGPMFVAEFQQGQFARLAPNPYFRTGKPATAGVIFSFFNTADSIAQGLKSGNLDYGMNLTAAQWTDLSKDPNINVGESRTEQRDFLAFNTLSGKGAGSTKALQDPAFRDAIGYSIDLKAIITRAYRGHAEAGVGALVPKAAEYYSDLSDIKRRFDLAEAGRRLDVAGYRDTNGDGVREDKEGKSFQLELITGNISGNIDVPIAAVQLIAAWLAQIGIPVSVTQLEPGLLETRTAAPEKGGGGWDLVVTNSWPSVRPGAQLSLASGKQIGAGNRSYWSNKEFDALLSDLNVTVEMKKRRELVDRAVRLLYTEAPYIILSYPLILEAHRKACFEGWGTEGMLSMTSYFPLDRLRPI
ncbi:ABC transporter substrate-binding protein [Bradyrhizobium sp. 187]|uniref:ABC transporter substrate-binding protein n=1 Tax=Bradyrhizobium sp. 187 TaxID=2782655 RepID=UPI001FFF27AB|nr:ABC transporter substrate-binding protein [Bradyrhizobium sp. 187]UPJ76879.1 ABC transporter substrate-binding protein [Bradyrhizobium sp. 187]